MSLTRKLSKIKEKICGNNKYIITDEILKNTKFGSGKLSVKRCKEINNMKIKNPYYPNECFSCHSEYYIVERDYLRAIHSEDENIVFFKAFSPSAVWIREEGIEYDKINILIIKNKYFVIVFDEIKYEKKHTEHSSESYIKIKIRENINLVFDPFIENQKINERIDCNEIIGLIKKIFINLPFYKEYSEDKISIEYRGDIY